jgi:hypothetical protein
MGKSLLHRILFDVIPTYLLRGVLGCYVAVYRVRTSWSIRYRTGGEELRVYDLLESGPRHQFMVPGLIVHNCNYGAGGKKIHRSLRQQGVDLTLEQATEIVDSHRRLYHASGRGFQEELKREWDRHGGWVYDGFGMPVAVSDEAAKKDLPNRVIQRTGHLVLMVLLRLLHDALTEAGIQPQGIVWDFHDQYIYQVPREQAEKARTIGEQAMRELNELLGTTVTLKGDVRLVEGGMAEAKMETEWGALHGAVLCL